MNRIIRGEFEKSREPSYLAEEQGGYDGCFLQEKSQEREGRRFMLTRTIGSTHEIPFRGFVGGKTETSSFGFANCEVRNPDKVESFVVGASTWTRAEVQAFWCFRVL
jgi:hypothetical protein